MRMKIQRSTGISDFVTSDSMFKQVKSKWDIAREAEAAAAQEKNERDARELLNLMQHRTSNREDAAYDLRGCMGRIDEIAGARVTFRFAMEAKTFMPAPPTTGWRMSDVVRDMSNLTNLISMTFTEDRAVRLVLDSAQYSNINIYENETHTVRVVNRAGDGSVLLQILPRRKPYFSTPEPSEYSDFETVTENMDGTGTVHRTRSNHRGNF